MSLVNLSISRHILTASVCLVVMLLGLLAYRHLQVDRYPDVEFPSLSISTALPGASLQTVAETLTQPLESRLNSVTGIDTLRSSSFAGLSVITATFTASTDLAQALNEVQSRLMQARQELPADAEAPIVQKFAMNAAPVMWMTLTGPRARLELLALAKRLKQRIEPLKGVGEVRLVGAAERMLVVTVKDARLSALNLTYADIERAFQQNHINMAGGRLKTAAREYKVDLPFEYATPQHLSEMAVAEVGKRVVRLRELAEVQEAEAHTRELARYDGQAAIAIGVTKSTGSNAIDVIEAVRHRLETEQASLLPPDVTLTFAIDEKAPVAALVNALQQHLIEATLLTGLVVWLFLKSARATTIISTAIPVSLLGAVASLYLFGYSLNSFTLLALLLLIGVVVDDAIVVLENIYRVRQQYPALDVRTACARGTAEVQSAVMAATLTFVSVFGPVIFIPGVLGQFLGSFSVTVVVGVLVSWLVSITLTPMLCAQLLAGNQGKSSGGKTSNASLAALQGYYLQVLSFCIAHRRGVLIAAFATLLPACLFLGAMKTEFTPQADEGRIAIELSLPPGLAKDDIQRLALLAESQLQEVKAVRAVMTTFEDHGRFDSDRLSLLLVFDKQHKLAQQNLIGQLEQRFAQVPGWRAQVLPANGVGNHQAGSALQFHLRGPDSSRLHELAQALHLRLTALPGMQSLNSTAGASHPQLKAHINFSEASRLGIASADISRAIAAFNGSMILGRYTASDADRYPVVLRSDAGVAADTTHALERIKVRTRHHTLVPLSALVEFKHEGVARSLQRIDQQFAVSFYGNPTIALGQALAHVRHAAEDLPPGYSIAYSGQSEEMRNAGKTLAIVFGGALLLMYLVLASQFNNLTQPLLIMLALPLAAIGGVSALYFAGQTLNVYSMIGLLMLVGLVAKNSILLVDKTNHLVDRGMAVDDALKQACPARLRAVLMTSLTVMLAMAPAAMGYGAAAQSHQSLAIAILGGMASATLLTLVVIPAAYSLAARAPAALAGAQGGYPMHPVSGQGPA